LHEPGGLDLDKLAIENVFHPGESEYFILNEDCYQDQHDDQLLASYQDWAEVKLRDLNEWLCVWPGFLSLCSTTRSTTLRIQ
jgi:hypothetical protein